jgi:hypothetical protein
MTHWKKLTNPDYIGAYDFAENEKRIVKIIEVKQAPVMGADGKKQDCIVATLENSKPWVLCKTNCKTISKILNTPMIENWSGKLIQLEVKKVKAFGEWVDGLRVCDKLPEPPKEELTPTHPRWAGAKEALTTGKTTIEQIEKSFILSPENKELLCSNSK